MKVQILGLIFVFLYYSFCVKMNDIKIKVTLVQGNKKFKVDMRKKDFNAGFLIHMVGKLIKAHDFEITFGGGWKSCGKNTKCITELPIYNIKDYEKDSEKLFELYMDVGKDLKIEKKPMKILERFYNVINILNEEYLSFAERIFWRILEIENYGKDLSGQNTIGPHMECNLEVAHFHV